MRLGMGRVTATRSMSTCPAELGMSNLFLSPPAVEPDALVSWGLLVLRVGAGSMLFYVHGWHKLKGGIHWLRQGTPWPLLGEVKAMHMPLPVLNAFAATLAQFVCAPLLVVGLFTHACGAVLTATLGVAVLQNLLARRDPQLVILYLLAVATLAIAGGGRWSLDAAWSSHATGADLAGTYR
jgi:putative oxidoreductase